MKILHLLPNYHPSKGGCQTIVKEVSERLIGNYGDEVTVFTTNAIQSPHAPNVQLIADGREVVEGVEVYRFPFLRVNATLKAVSRVNGWLGRPLGDYPRLFRSGPLSLSMLRATAVSDAELVIGSSHPYLTMFYPHVGRLLGRRRPFLYHGALHVGEFNSYHIPEYVMAGIRMADAYLAHTDYEREVLVERGVEAEKIHVWAPGVDIGAFKVPGGSNVRERLGVADGPIVGYIGRLAAHKGIDTLVAAMQNVWSAYPEAHLLIAGAHTKYVDEIRRLIERLSTPRQKQVTLVLDFDDSEKASLFEACDVFVCASSEESYGIAFLEAWAASCAVVGSRIGAVRCVVTEGEDGLLVSYGDSQELAASIRLLLSNDELRLRLARVGGERVRTDHSWDEATVRLRSIYSHILTNYDPGRGRFTTSSGRNHVRN